MDLSHQTGGTTPQSQKNSSTLYWRDRQEFDEAAESAVEKWKFLLNRVIGRKIPPKTSDDDKEKEEASVWYIELEQERVIVGFVLINCKTSHRTNRSSQSPENDKKVVCWSTYHKWYYAVNKELDAYRRLLGLLLMI